MGGVSLDPVVLWILRGSVALLLLLAAAHKLRAPRDFRAMVADYALLPSALLPAFAWGLPVLEAGLGIALAFEATAVWAARASAGLFALYAFAIAVNLVRGRRHVACGCFGPAAERPIHAGLVLRNSGLAGVALAGSLAATPRSLGAPDAFTVAAAIACLASAYFAADALLGADPHRVSAPRGLS